MLSPVVICLQNTSTSTPVKDQKATTVAACLFDKYITEHGLPESFHSDQGGQFQGHLFQELCTLMGIDKTRTTPYWPQGDGAVERVHRTIKDHIARRLHEHGHEWDRVVNQVQFCYNTAIHSTTGHSPFFLTHGREPILPVHVLLGHRPSDITSQHSEFAKDLQIKFTKAYKSVQDLTHQAQKSQAHYYDRKTRFRNYAPGEMVMMKNPRRDSKVDNRYLGPFVVIKHTSDGRTYQLLNKAKPSAKPITIHHDKLKPYVAPLTDLWEIPDVQNIVPKLPMAVPTSSNTSLSPVTILVDQTPPGSQGNSPQHSPHPTSLPDSNQPPTNEEVQHDLHIADTANKDSPTIFVQESQPQRELPQTSSGRKRFRPSKLDEFILD